VASAPPAFDAFQFLPMPAPKAGEFDPRAGNTAGPKILLWGDSHAGHSLAGFMALREMKPNSRSGA
jgi:hypothetical protein